MDRNPPIAIQRPLGVIFFHSLRGPQRNLTRFDGNVKRSPLTRSGARFSKVPVTFRARNRNIENKSAVLASRVLYFVSLTASFIMLDAKLLKSLSCM